MEQHHKSSRGRVVGTIVAGTLVVGFLGGLAGVALNPPPGPRPAVADDSPDVEVAPVGPGRSVLRTLSVDSETPDPGCTWPMAANPKLPLPFITQSRVSARS